MSFCFLEYFGEAFYFGGYFRRFPRAEPLPHDFPEGYARTGVCPNRRADVHQSNACLCTDVLPEHLFALRPTEQMFVNACLSERMFAFLRENRRAEIYPTPSHCHFTY